MGRLCFTHPSSKSNQNIQKTKEKAHHLPPNTK
uniref:Uncharacterized protein n=1 Tax=Rhizophora mucronata TaxID=61149 RepID=A0A2P2Q2H5_RHIMU